MTPQSFAQPRWDGGPLAGRTIFLYAEQGMGDTIQFIRYVPLVKERGGQVIVACQSPLLSLLSSCPGIDQVLTGGADLPRFDCHSPLMSLPGILGTTLDTIPAKVPYLFPNPELVERWRQEAGSTFGVPGRVGLARQSGTHQ